MVDRPPRPFSCLLVQDETVGDAVNKVMKHAKKELTKLGCKVELEDARRIEFRLRDGGSFCCTVKTQMQTVRSVVARERAAFRVQTGEYLSGFPEAPSAPRLEVGNYYAPAHFRERATLMRKQGLRNSEITTALLAPETVRKSEHTGRWIYCAGRIGVVVHPPAHGIYTLVTILWATDDLWEQNPRPEREEV